MNRPLLRRLLHIRKRIHAGPKPVNTRVLSSELEVTRKTVWRDIEFLKDLGDAIEFDCRLNTYRYACQPRNIFDL